MNQTMRRHEVTTAGAGAGGLRRRRHGACCMILRALTLVALAAVPNAVVAAVESSSDLPETSGRPRPRRRQQEGFLSNVTTDGTEETGDLPPLIRVWVSYKEGVTHDVSIGSLQTNLEQVLELPENVTNFDGLMVPDQDLVPPTRRRRTSASGSNRKLQPEEVVANNFQMHYDFFESGVASIAMSVTPQVLEALRNDPTVRKVRKDPRRYPLGAVESSFEDAPPPRLRSGHRELDEAPYGIGMVRAAAAWNRGYRGQGITVCIIDTGLDMKHPEYANTGFTGVSSAAGTWSTDGYGHGTHVVGTVAARSNGLGVVGVAPLANVVMVKVFDKSGKYAYGSSVGDAALQCKKKGAKVINMSLGGTGSSQAENDIFAFLLKNGVVSVAAAANAGTNTYYYPASYASVVSVAAIDSNQKVASFSQKNDRVDLAAPGVSVYSTLPLKNAGLCCKYGYLSGTSMATPHVAGVAALLFSKNATKPASAIVSAMTSTAVDLGKTGYDTSYGHGLVSAGRALRRV